MVVRRGEEGEQQFLLTQRPSKGSVWWVFSNVSDGRDEVKHILLCAGLLAGLWEFPCVPYEDKNGGVKDKKVLCAEVNRILGTGLSHSLLQYVGEVSLASLSRPQ